MKVLDRGKGDESPVIVRFEYYEYEWVEKLANSVVGQGDE